MAFSTSQPLAGEGGLRISQSTAPDGARIYLFHPLSGSQLPDIRRFAGVTFSRAFVGSSLERALADVAGAGVDTRPVFAVFEAGRPMLAGAGWSGRAESRTSLAPLLPLWDIAGAYSGTTVEEIARGQFRRNLWISLLALAALGAASFATLTLAAREARLAREKAAFISGISHEMKTPLALISMYAETLESGRVSSPGKLREYHATIVRESRRLAALIENVLDFARLQSGRAPLRRESVDLGELVAEVVAANGDRLRESGFQVSIEIEDSLPPVDGDRVALSRALLNLLDNAAKYSAETKDIAVAARRAGDSVRVEVADRGIGIAPAEQGKIFEQFYRAGDPLTREVRGAGLGLALVREIVAAHRGRVELRSAPGKGSAFAVVLPATGAHPEV